MTGQQLRQARETLGISQRQLARAAAVSSHEIRALESGRRAGSTNTWARVQAAVALASLDAETAASRIYAELAP